MSIAVEEIAGSRVLSPKEIYELYLIRKSLLSWRDSLYREFKRYYFPEAEQRSQGGVIAMNAYGMPVLRSVGESLQKSRQYIARRLPAIIDDYQALLGHLPQSRGLPPDPHPEGQNRAEMATHYLVSTWDLSYMDEHHASAALNLSMLGDGCYMADPYGATGRHDRHLDGRVLLSSVPPDQAYPSFLTGSRQYELYDLLIAERKLPEEIHRLYGIPIHEVKTRNENVVITYISPRQRSVVVCDVPTQYHVEWDIGFCPAVWVFNKQAGGRFAQSDIANAMRMEDYYDYSLNLAADAAYESTYAITHVVNPEAFEGGVGDVGPGSTVRSTEEGKIIRVQPNPPPETALKMADRAQHDLQTATGTTEVRQTGTMESSITTGRAIHNAQGPQATRLSLKLQRLSRALEELNSRALRLQENAPDLPESFEIWGRYQGKDFREDFNPKEHINGWYRNKVTFNKMIGMNEQQKTITAMQGMQADLISDITAREDMGIEDPMGERERIRDFKLWQSRIQAEQQKIMMEAQQPGTPPGGGPPPGPGAGQTPGAAAPPPPTQQILRPATMPNQPAPPGGVPQGVSVAALRTALQAVTDQLKGHVYAIGEMVLRGESQTPRLRIPSWEDYRVVKAALASVAPEAEVRQMNEDRLPQLHEMIV